MNLSESASDQIYRGMSVVGWEVCDNELTSICLFSDLLRNVCGRLRGIWQWTYQYLPLLRFTGEGLWQIKWYGSEGHMGENSGLTVAPGHTAFVIVVLQTEHNLSSYWQHHPRICTLYKILVSECTNIKQAHGKFSPASVGYNIPVSNVYYLYLQISVECMYVERPFQEIIF